MLFRICFFFGLCCSYILHAEQYINLRDLSFNTPNPFTYYVDVSEKIETNVFKEAGVIYSDENHSVDQPNLQFQYFEMKGFPVKGAENILNYLHEVMEKSMQGKPKSIITKPEERYSLALYDYQGKSLFEIKSLGEKGWLNIQYVADIENDVNSMRIMQSVLTSINHKYPYSYKENPFRKKFEAPKSEPGRRSRWGLVLVIVSVVLFVIKKVFLRGR